MTASPAVGVFDSGIGGLNVLRHALQAVAAAPLLYVADCAYAPYGVREPREVIARSREIARFLLEQGAGALVVACNTATAVAVDVLRAEFDPPIVAMEPALIARLRRRLGLADGVARRSAVRLFSSSPPDRLREQALALIGLEAPCAALPSRD